MRKRKLALLLSSFMLISTLAGCGSSAETSGGDVSTSAEGQVLKIAGLDAAYGKAHWEKMAKNFEAANEGVTVELTFESNIEEVIRPQIQAGNVPDIIYLATGRKDGLTETFIKEQSLHDLSGMLNKKVPGEDVTVKEKILPGFVDNTVTNPYGDGKTYLAPLFYSPTGLFYNKALFKEKGYELPKTWDEMFALGDKSKADGISLLSYPHTGYFDCVMPPLLASAGGLESFESAMNYEEGFWNSEEATLVLNTVEKFKEYLEPSVISNANPQNFINNQQLILDNKALFIPNGTWLPDEMKDAPRADGFEWGFMAYPAFKEGGDQYSVSFIEQMYIPKDAANKELAEDFMAYVYSDEAVAIIAENAKAVSPVTGSIEIASQYLDPLQVELLSMYDNGAKAILGGFAATEPIEGLNFTDIYVGTIDSIMTGDKTVEEWQKALTEASDKLREAIIK